MRVVTLRGNAKHLRKHLFTPEENCLFMIVWRVTI